MVKKLFKSVHIYRSYRQNNPGGPFFWTTRYCVGYCFSAVARGEGLAGRPKPVTHCLYVIRTFESVFVHNYTTI